jgi:hypothetical protein
MSPRTTWWPATQRRPSRYGGQCPPTRAGRPKPSKGSMWHPAWWLGTRQPLSVPLGGAVRCGGPRTTDTRLPSSLVAWRGQRATPGPSAPPVPSRPPTRGGSHCAPTPSTQPCRPPARGRPRKSAKGNMPHALVWQARCRRPSAPRTCAVHARAGSPKRLGTIWSRPPRSMCGAARGGWPQGHTRAHAYRLWQRWQVGAQRGTCQRRIRQQYLDNGGPHKG